MSFLAKLFGRKKSKVEEHRLDSEIVEVKDGEKGMAKEVDVDQCRLSDDALLALKVRKLSKSGKFAKDYQLVHDFLVYTDAEKINDCGECAIDPANLGEESISFIKQYRFRKLRCTDEQFQEWIRTVVI